MAQDKTAGYAMLFERHQAALIRYLYGMVGEVETARDLTQETFVRGYKLWLAEAERGEGWRPLLYRIATNCALDVLRRRSKIRFSPWAETYEEDAGPPESAPTATGNFDLSSQLEVRLAVLEALRGLDPEAATCLLLHYDQGFSSAEIAAITGHSVQAIWQRLSRARRLFSSLYQKEQANDA
jgi:RNA polymerase sigma-70 factor (ECF subfamily)